MEKEIQLDMNRIPAHVAIIMDGNGRWAKQRGLERTLGHQAGAERFIKLQKKLPDWEYASLPYILSLQRTGIVRNKR